MYPCSINIETSVRIRGTTPTCTQEKCQYYHVFFTEECGILANQNIDFSSARGKKQKLAIDDCGEAAIEPQHATVHGTETELETLF